MMIIARLARRFALMCAGAGDGAYAIADLDEEYEPVVARVGAWRADAWYVAQMVRSVPAFLALRGRVRRSTASSRALIVDSIAHDLRFTARAYRRTPFFTAIAVVTIALGIGATTAIFSVFEGVVLRALPFRDPERLVAIGQMPSHVRDAGIGASSSKLAVDAIRDAADLFEESAAYIGTRPVLTGLGDPTRLDGAWVPANFFTLLGARPLIGRTFSADEDRQSGPPAVVISYGFWSTRMGADEGAVGGSILLDGVRATVVGVMPPEFRFPDEATIWRSMSARPAASGPAPTWPQGIYQIVARLRRTVTADRAEQAMTVRYAGMAKSLPAFVGWHARILPVKDALIGTVRRPLTIMLAAVGLVLLIACANVANLLLARAVAREREIAVRTAIGAESRRIVRLFLTESVTLAIAGGALGVAVAWAAVPILLSRAEREIPGIAEIGVNVRVLLAATALMVTTGILFGSVPAMHAVRTQPADALRAANATGSSRWIRRVTDGFTVLQVALTVVLLVGAGLLGESFTRLMSVDMGFDPSRIVAAQVQLGKARYPSAEARLEFSREVLARLQADRATQVSAMSTGIPLSTAAVGTIDVDNRKLMDAVAVFTAVTDGYFDVFQLSLVRGHLFDRGSINNKTADVLVNESFVRQFLPTVDPIGHTVSYYDGAANGRIVGVVSDARQSGLARPVRPEIYEAFERDPASYINFVVRSTGNITATSAALRRAIAQTDALVPIDRLVTMRGLMAATVARQQFYATLLAIFAASALLIAAAGIYAVMTYIVTERTRELGIRIALGAARRDILAIVMSRGLGLAGAGALAGIVGAAAVTRVLRTLLFGVTPTDPSVFVAGAVGLGVVALVACYAPAVRALRIDPLAAVRSE